MVIKATVVTALHCASLTVHSGKLHQNNERAALVMMPVLEFKHQDKNESTSTSTAKQSQLLGYDIINIY